MRGLTEPSRPAVGQGVGQSRPALPGPLVCPLQTRAAKGLLAEQMRGRQKARLWRPRPLLGRGVVLEGPGLGCAPKQVRRGTLSGC